LTGGIYFATTLLKSSSLSTATLVVRPLALEVLVRDDEDHAKAGGLPIDVVEEEDDQMPPPELLGAEAVVEDRKAGVSRDGRELLSDGSLGTRERDGDIEVETLLGDPFVVVLL
jgi:hypothetical protein